MPLTISDDLLEAAGLSPGEARIEIACRMFDAGKLALWPAARWAGLSRVEFEAELHRRGIPIYRPTIEDITSDLAAFERLDAQR
jgi:predicted HTH domain antitoxin